ncbi:unnamed protein product [Gongylonema pulchrum]|uniref:Ubiquitin fusion degradation protein 1 homolog n=1 Tax=Gongylonema pulchrum TaxID=637853 RepID=A0A183DWX0_9BILA|nr:unnamed protein product [Gongylonema pulchrum]
MFDGLGAVMFGMPAARPFDLQLRCFSAPFYERADSKKINELNHGGKILLPPSALDLLVRLNIEYPMMFRVSSLSDPELATHCGVLEFLAEEGRAYLPSWLHLNEGECVRITYASLPKATYTKLKPQSTDFLAISNPRAVLEVELRKFACLTKGDIIAVESLPTGAAAEVVGSKTGGGFAAFSGAGHRLDGKSKASSSSLAEMDTTERSLPALTVNTNYTPGNLNFVRYDYKCRAFMEKHLADASKSKKTAGTVPFEGGGHALRATRR